jgi:O-antigen biosynthesis protein
MYRPKAQTARTKVSLRASPVGKIWRSVSKHGLRAGLLDALARWSMKRSNIPRNVLEDYGWAVSQEHAPMLCPPKTGPLRINWLVPDSEGRGRSGGLFNIFRVIHHMERWGHEHRVYVVGKTDLNEERAKEFVQKYYFQIKAPIRIFRGQVADSDALVATHWSTAYIARGLGNTAKKFYFVQDLEHLFYPHGSLHELAEQTYCWGFYGIAAGQWVADVLQSEFGMECSVFRFSCDREIYYTNGAHRLPSQGKRVLFYARPETERRGFELGILALSIVARKMPNTEFVLVGNSLRSVKLPFPANLPGVLTSRELGPLYRSCDVALVLSHTNVSLLPLELMACGCAVVSNSGPNVEWLLTGETAQLARPTPEALANAVLALLDSDHLRSQKVAAASAFVQKTDWISEIRRVETAFCRGLNLPGRKKRNA